MNANELADELLKVVNVSSHVKMCASDMLRRQQSEIEALRKERKGLCVFCENRKVNSPAKTLTDEEIEALAYSQVWNGLVDFAKAILKKASEQ